MVQVRIGAGFELWVHGQESREKLLLQMSVSGMGAGFEQCLHGKLRLQISVSGRGVSTRRERENGHGAARSEPHERYSGRAGRCLVREFFFYASAFHSRRSTRVIWFREGSPEEGDRIVAGYKLECELGLNSGFTENYSCRSP